MTSQMAVFFRESYFCPQKSSRLSFLERHFEGIPFLEIERHFFLKYSMKYENRMTVTSTMAQGQTGRHDDVIFSTLSQENLLKLSSVVVGASVTHSGCMKVTPLKSFTFGKLGFPSGHQMWLLAAAVLVVFVWRVLPFLDLPHFLRAMH